MVALKIKQAQERAVVVEIKLAQQPAIKIALATLSLSATFLRHLPWRDKTDNLLLYPNLNSRVITKNYVKRIDTISTLIYVEKDFFDFLLKKSLISNFLRKM